MPVCRSSLERYLVFMDKNNDEVYGNLTPEKAVAILKDYKMKGLSNA